MNNREKLIEIFEDTARWCRENERLRSAVQKSIAGTKVYKDGCRFTGAAQTGADGVRKVQAGADGVRKVQAGADGVRTIQIGADGVGIAQPGAAGTETVQPGAAGTEIAVEKHKSFEAAMLLRKKYPEARIAVHNFASATNPGGGVRKGSTAQEECLCRCSTLYPVLNTGKLMEEYYLYHRSRHDVRYTDTCIYTPDIWIIKTDTDMPDRMPEAGWCKVDVLTCAAPNLRPVPHNSMNPGTGKPIKIKDRELLELHKARTSHMLNAAADNHVDILVLGAFGCGAFQNSPEIVARAYKEILPEFKGIFRRIEFAVYCTPRDSRNYDVFRRVLGQKTRH